MYMQVAEVVADFKITDHQNELWVSIFTDYTVSELEISSK